MVNVEVSLGLYKTKWIGIWKLMKKNEACKEFIEIHLPTNQVQYIQENGLVKNEMVKENKFGQMEHNMKVNFLNKNLNYLGE